ncbi:helix-turn-helix domain-containing protein [Flagellimonas flava]|uniref:AraC-type DNA-binding protein n=1 Tax=Flagellimonas flava TaxID=570519 RepID=A0A1M5P830_9FLAO|nr:helix-turn-helix domain-containing protein [Allomuricauda flava]SHG97956.1 AraC-type DNA-binding protein [Allomuricauda flava]
MNLSLNPFQFIFLLGGVHGLLIFFAVILKKNRGKNRLIFSLFLLSISLACIKIALQEIFPVFWSTFPIPLLFQFAWGPLLLLYTRSILYNKFASTAFNFSLFIPSFLFDFLFVLVSKLGIIDLELFYQMSFIIDIAAAIHFSFFIFQSIGVLKSYRKGLEGFYSNISEETINWLVSLYIICGVMLVCWLLYILSSLYLSSFDLPFANLKTYYFSYIWLSATIYYLVYRWHVGSSIQQIDKPVKSRKSVKRLLYDPNEIFEQVSKNKYYLDPKLTLKKLANQMELNINDLSQTINIGLGKTFSDFINELRVDEVKQKIHDPKYAHLNYLGIAMESGFNSKATFNRAFKKFTGENPTTYLKK